jgi:hypothetical protein
MLGTFTCQLFTESECNELISHFFEKQSIILANTNHNAMYDGRVLDYFLCDTPIKNLLHKKSLDLATYISRFYGDENVYPETIHTVSWNVGTSLGTHADNSWPDGTPNYTPDRDYSATVILNEEFTGGEFYFESNSKKYLIPTRKGWCNAFGSGLNYTHGVNEVLSGHRFTVAIWYTKDYSKSICYRQTQ